MRADDETSAATTLQVRFGAGLSIINFLLAFNFTFSNYHQHRADPASNIRTSQMQTVGGNFKIQNNLNGHMEHFNKR
jgi:hypothetical protein